MYSLYISNIILLYYYIIILYYYITILLYYYITYITNIQVTQYNLCNQFREKRLNRFVHILIFQIKHFSRKFLDQGQKRLYHFCRKFLACPKFLTFNFFCQAIRFNLNKRDLCLIGCTKKRLLVYTKAHFDRRSFWYIEIPFRQF